MKTTNSILTQLSTFIFCLFTISVFSQVTAADYKIVMNNSTNEYDLYLRILEGGTKNTKQRIQFNSQIAIVVPTGNKVEITKNYMPIQDNQEYKGTLPMEWEMMKALVAPPAMPKNDFYAFRPTLIPTALYNDLKPGDEVKLFSFKCPAMKKDEVRLFKNGEDPSSHTGMYGRDFFNSFCLGSVTNIYKNSTL